MNIRIKRFPSSELIWQWKSLSLIGDTSSKGPFSIATSMLVYHVAYQSLFTDLQPAYYSLEK